MKSHLSSLIPRMIRAGLRVRDSRYRVVAVGLDYRSRIIGIATNRSRLPKRGYHAEEVLIHRLPRSLSKILIVRVGSRGDLLPIDACEKCEKLARKFGISIKRIA